MAKQPKQKESLLQQNGRGYVAGVWLTPLQAKGMADMLKISIPQYEGTIIGKPKTEQINYLASLNKRLEDAELLAGLLRA